MRYTVIARLVALAAGIVLMTASGAEAATGVAPGAPGATALWTAGNKDGFGTSTTLNSKVWYTLNGGELTEVYYPDLGTPAVRDMQFVVTDGKSWVERETDGTDHALRLTDSRSLSYQQINSDPHGRFRIVKTYTTDPSRSTLLMRVHFESLTKQPLHLYLVYDPSLSGNGDDDSGSTVGSFTRGVGRQVGQRSRRLAGVHRDLERLPRDERRLERPLEPRRDGVELHLRTETATSCRPVR